MKKKNIFIFCILILVSFTLLFLTHYYQKKNSITVTTSDLKSPIQSNLFFTLIGSEKSENMFNLDKKILNKKGFISTREKIEIKNDGKIVLKVKINSTQYQSTIIPYVTRGNNVSSLKISFSKKNNNIIIIGKYVTLLAGEKKIYTKLEKVESHENKK